MNLLIADFGYGDVKYIVTDEEFKSFKKGNFPMRLQESPHS